MTYPTTTTPIREAVVHALTKHTGMPRCIPRERLYVLGRPAELLEPPRPGELYRRPRAFVAPIEPIGFEPHLQMTDRMRVDINVEIRTWYFGGDGVGSREWEEASKLWEQDALNVYSALTYPGNLANAPDGTETGLLDGSLPDDRERYRPRVQVLPKRTAEQRELIVQVGHVFRARAELTRPT